MTLECMFILSLCMPLVFAPVDDSGQTQALVFEGPRSAVVVGNTDDDIPTPGNLPEPPEEPYQCSDERFVNDLTECEYDEREEQQEREFDDCGPQRSEQFKQEIGCPSFEQEEEEEEPEEQDDPSTAWDETCRPTEEAACLD